MNRQSGFTIYELLTVIAIIAILSVIAVPNVIAWRSDAKLRGAFNNIIADLQLAKSTALRENATVAVLFSQNGYSIFIDNGAGANANNWSLDADEAFVRKKALPAGVTIVLPTSFDSLNNRTRFNGRGFPDQATLTGSGLTGTLTLEDTRGSQKKITVNRLGRISNS